jgi:hypothetical protein
MGVHRGGGRSASAISAFAWVIAENVIRINAKFQSFTPSYLPRNAPRLVIGKVQAKAWYKKLVALDRRLCFNAADWD